MRILKIMKSKLSIIIIGMVVLVSLAQLAIAHNLATVGEKVRQLEIKANQLEQENVILAEEINKIGSLSKIAQKAEELDFIKATQVLYITPQLPVAFGTSKILSEH